MKKEKKIVLMGSFVVGAISVSLSFLSHSLCGGDYYCEKGLSGVILIFLLSSILVFLFSLITYKMRDEVFRKWFDFAKWWVLLSVFFTLITSESGGGWGVGISWGKEDTSFIFSVIFTVISIMIISYQYTSKKHPILYSLACLALIPFVLYYSFYLFALPGYVLISVPFIISFAIYKSLTLRKRTLLEKLKGKTQ